MVPFDRAVPTTSTRRSFFSSSPHDIPEKPIAGAEVTVFKATSWKGVPSSTNIHDNIVVSPQSPGIDMQVAQATQLTENRMVATAGGQATTPGVQAATADHAMLERFRSHRPTLAQVNALVKACFANGKPVANAMDLIGHLTTG